MLTLKQKTLLQLIGDAIRRDGIPPSYDEMKDALGLKSKSGIHRLVTALEERGYLRRLPNKARAIELIKRPDSIAIYSGKAQAHELLEKVCYTDMAKALPDEVKAEIVKYFMSISSQQGLGVVTHSKLFLEAAE